MREDIEMLMAAIDESGMTIPTIAKRAGMDKYTLYNRLKGRGDWKASEIVGLSRALRLTNTQRDKIFL